MMNSDEVHFQKKRFKIGSDSTVSGLYLLERGGAAKRNGKFFDIATQTEIFWSPATHWSSGETGLCHPQHLDYFEFNLEEAKEGDKKLRELIGNDKNLFEWSPVICCQGFVNHEIQVCWNIRWVVRLLKLVTCYCCGLGLCLWGDFPQLPLLGTPTVLNTPPMDDEQRWRAWAKKALAPVYILLNVFGALGGALCCCTTDICMAGTMLLAIACQVIAAVFVGILYSVDDSDARIGWQSAILGLIGTSTFLGVLATILRVYDNKAEKIMEEGLDFNLHRADTWRKINEMDDQLYKNWEARQQISTSPELSSFLTVTRGASDPAAVDSTFRLWKEEMGILNEQRLNLEKSMNQEGLNHVYQKTSALRSKALNALGVMNFQNIPLQNKSSILKSAQEIMQGASKILDNSGATHHPDDLTFFSSEN